MAARAIAVYAGLHLRTVRRWIAAGQLGEPLRARGERNQWTMFFSRERVDAVLTGQGELDLDV